MFGQPEAIRRTWDRNRESLTQVAKHIVAGSFTRVFLVGAGDSLAVMVAARNALELMTGLACEPVQSLEFAYYLQHLVDDRSIVIALSSSGETTRTVESVLLAQHATAFTLALTNTQGSTLDQESDTTLLIEATRVGWPTQSSSAALALLLKLAVEIGTLRGVPLAAGLAAELASAPDLVDKVLADNDAPIAALAKIEAARETFLFSSAGPNLAAAIVGAAKVKECTPNHAEPIQVEEFHHYNSLKAGEPLFILIPSGPSVPRAVETGREARRFGGQLYVVTTEGERSFDDAANVVLTMPAIHEALSGLLYVVPAQLIGYHLGMAKFAAAEAELHG
jgi:glucosamine 6-phosphate synthetase-like amidotransferase/phosphosugar isomerase protein